MLKAIGLLSARAALLILASSVALAEQPKRDIPPNKNGAAARSIAAVARALIDHGRYQDAVIALDGAIKQDPNNGMAYALRGQAKNRMGQIRESSPIAIKR